MVRCERACIAAIIGEAILTCIITSHISMFSNQPTLSTQSIWHLARELIAISSNVRLLVAWLSCSHSCQSILVFPHLTHSIVRTANNIHHVDPHTQYDVAGYQHALYDMLRGIIVSLCAFGTIMSKVGLTSVKRTV